MLERAKAAGVEFYGNDHKDRDIELYYSSPFRRIQVGYLMYFRDSQNIEAKKAFASFNSMLEEFRVLSREEAGQLIVANKENDYAYDPGEAGVQYGKWYLRAPVTDGIGMSEFYRRMFLNQNELESLPADRDRNRVVIAPNIFAELFPIPDELDRQAMWQFSRLEDRVGNPGGRPGFVKKHFPSFYW